MTRLRLVAASVLAVSASVAAATTMPSSASAERPDPTVRLTPLGTYATGAFDEGGSEIVAYDAKRFRAFSVNAQAGTVDVLDISDPTAPARIATLATPGANSVAVQGRTIAVAEQAADKTDTGNVALFDAATLRLIKTVPAGALPDMVTITDDGDWALVANEGEPEGYCAGQTDPRGSVSVIDLRHGAARATARTASFTKYDGKEAALRAAGIRIFGPGASASQDIEPEYVAVDKRNDLAYVTLQENNAVAVVDIKSATVKDLRPLGLKDHSVSGRGLDPSDKDGGAKIGTWPVFGMYQPDSIASYTAKGGTYLVTANEGDARDWDCFAEEVRVKDASVVLDPTVFPDAAELKKDANLGRLNVTTTSPRNAAGQVTQLQSFGARSFSIRDDRGRLVWDSGDGLERLTSVVHPELFNADHTENDSADARSDNKGPEPEGLDLGKISGRTYAFVGLERNSGIAVADVTDPRRAALVGYGVNRDDAGDPEAGTAGDLGPEGVHFVAAQDSPNRRPLLLVGNEISGTTTVWQVSLDR